MKSITYSTMRLQAVASKDRYRESLSGVFIDSKAVVATDGHCLAVKPRQVDDELDSGIYAFKASKEAQKLGIDSFNGAKFGSNGSEYRPIDGNFPDWKLVIPQSAPNKITLDLALLNKIYEAIGEGKKDKCITIHFDVNCPTSPSFITADDSVGVGLIMPMRSDIYRDPISELAELR